MTLQETKKPMPTTGSSIDPVTLTLLWNRLLAITEEMGSTLRRTAFTEAVREGDDFSTGLFDGQARLIAQGNFTPGHMGSMPSVVRSVLEIFPADTMKSGDGFLMNDAALGSGHFPDIFLVTPIFLKEKLIGYAVDIAHHVDVGGAAPGSQEVAGVVEAYQEGLRILPVKFVRDNEFDSDILRMILANVRVPDKLLGDLKAQRNANFVGANRYRELYESHGEEMMDLAIEEILTRSETRIRDRISELPDGTYVFEDSIDDSGPNTDRIHVHVAITIKDDHMTIDFSGSSDQVPAGINSYINYTIAYSSFAAKVLTDAILPQNDGASRPITVTARKGSFFNPQFPAPSGGRAAIQIRIFEAVNGAISQVLPKRAMGAHSHWSNPNVSGVDDRNGKRFVQYDLIFGGLGALSWKDGVEGMSPVMNCSNVPVEVMEANNPIMFHCLEFIQDSGGAGRYRGGSGMRKDIEIMNSSALVTLLGDRHKNKPYGLFEGEGGALAKTTLYRNSKETALGSKQTLKLKKGDVISFHVSGGGGYGPASDRDPENVENDLADGYISQERADYYFEQIGNKKSPPESK